MKGEITRKIIIVALAAVFIIIIASGYLGWTYIENQPPPNPTSPPSLSPEQIRDQTMLYIEANHTQTIPLMQNLEWSGGRQETGLLGSEKYLYSSGNWELQIQYPVVPNPLYSLTANYTSGNMTVAWSGTYQNGILTETSNVITATYQVALTQEQVRDLTMQYISTNHAETAQYMNSHTWTGGRTTPEGIVGGETYSYQNSGWNVTIHYPVVPNPIYSITVEYAPIQPYFTQATSSNAIVSWQGTMQNGTITETSYEFSP
jgi:hypothetical protein